MNIFFKPFICILIVIPSTLKLSAQVKSKSFNYVLKTLLSHNVPTINVDEASGNKSTYVFLDAREEEEYNVSHIPNAYYVGYDHFNLNNLPPFALSKNIIVYCSIGKRSENITELLRKKGYTNVYNLYGGIFEWFNHGYTINGPDGKPTDSIHGYSRFWGRFLTRGVKVY